MSRFASFRMFLVLAAVALVASGAFAQTPGLTDHPAWTPEGSRTTTQPQAPGTMSDEPAAIAKRLFAALLNREPSGLELEQAAGQIDGGQRDTLINTLLGSSEYRRLRTTKTPNTLLDQYFDGLFDRLPRQNAYSNFSSELSRGNDAAVVRTLLDSREFDDVIAGQSLEASAAEQACMKAIEERVSTDLRRTAQLTFLTIATASGSFFSDEIRGTAKLPDERGVDFACTTERLRGSIIEADYQVTAVEEQEQQRALMVRCESRDNRRSECPADTSGGVTLVRQRSRTTCQEKVNWGYTEQGIWVDKGCRADFRVMETVARQGLDLTARGSGFLFQEGSQVVWLGEARLDCAHDGTARLAFSGQSQVALSGVCYQFDEGQIEIGLASASGDWYTEGGGSATLKGGALSGMSLAGRTRFGQPFAITFNAESSSTGQMVQRGSGLLEVADGRRASAETVRIEPASNGRVTIVFEGQARFSFTGTWYRTWSGDYEITLDGGLDDATTRGAGSVRWLDDGSLKVELAGSASSVGGAWRVGFDGSAAVQ